MKGGSKDDLEFLEVDASADETTSMNQSYVVRQNEEDNNADVGAWLFRQSKHPMVAFFHLFFKAFSLFMYIFGSYFTSNYIVIFVVCIIALAFDFWTVKNISGRLLVGLRWWSSIKDDGSNEWIFESLQDMTEISAMDSRVFWWGMYASILLWGFLLFIGVLRLNFQYIPIVFAGIAMTGANLWGYMKCSADSQEKLRLLSQGMSVASSKAIDSGSIMMNFLTNAMLSAANATSNSRATNAAEGINNNSGRSSSTAVRHTVV